MRKRAPAQIGLNRPELAAFFLALRDMLIEEPLLYLCDNQSLLKAVTRCGCVDVLVCGCVGVWVCGCVGVWTCGCVDVWARGKMTIWSVLTQTGEGGLCVWVSLGVGEPTRVDALVCGCVVACVGVYVGGCGSMDGWRVECDCVDTYWRWWGHTNTHTHTHTHHTCTHTHTHTLVHTILNQTQEQKI